MQPHDGAPEDRVDAARIDDRKWKGGACKDPVDEHLWGKGADGAVVSEWKGGACKDPVDEHLRDDEGGNQGGSSGAIRGNQGGN